MPPGRNCARKLPRSLSEGAHALYVFNYRPPTKAFKLHLSFAKSQVDRKEIISALEAIIQDLRKER